MLCLPSSISSTGVLKDTEGGAASDNLDTINGGRDGALLILQAASSTHTVVVRDAVDNIVLPAARSLTHTDDTLILFYDGTNSLWKELSFADITV